MARLSCLLLANAIESLSHGRMRAVQQSTTELLRKQLNPCRYVECLQRDLLQKTRPEKNRTARVVTPRAQFTASLIGKFSHRCRPTCVEVVANPVYLGHLRNAEAVAPMRYTGGFIADLMLAATGSVLAPLEKCRRRGR